MAEGFEVGAVIFAKEAKVGEWQNARTLSCKGLWSLDKKAWCCKHYGVGCPTPAPAPAPVPTPPPEPNCAVGTPMTWDMGKKVWCCAHHHVGCPTTPCHYDCNEGFSNWQRGWSEGKKAFCCRTQ